MLLLLLLLLLPLLPDAFSSLQPLQNCNHLGGGGNYLKLEWDIFAVVVQVRDFKTHNILDKAYLVENTVANVRATDTSLAIPGIPRSYPHTFSHGTLLAAASTRWCRTD